MCGYTATRNKDPCLPTLADLERTVSAISPWEDTSFPPDKTSLFWEDAGESWEIADYVTSWKRISEVYGDGGYSLFGTNGVTPKDIFQGSVGNCWFMSALSAIAEKPNRVENMFVNTFDGQINPAGVYGVNMNALGVPITVLIDDFIPGYTSD